MILDFNEARRLYFLTLPRAGAPLTAVQVQTEHGFDFSTTASTAETAVLFTSDPFAALTFFDYATDRARPLLAPLAHEVVESWRATSEAHIAVPPGRELWPFQKADVEYALRRSNTLIGDQPGLGKTPTAIAFCNEVKAKSVLVICPANVRLQWEERIREWSTMRWPYVLYPILKSSSGTHPRANWTITSYDLARTPAIGGELAKRRFDVLILDEPHYLKDSGSLRTKAIFGGGRKSSFEALAGRADRILGLTGTPLPNRPREAFTLARGLCYDAIDFASEESFQERYNPVRRGTTAGGKIYTDERVGREFELQNRLRVHFMVRHLKHGPDGVLKQLKLPIYDLVRVEETGPVRAALAAERLLDLDWTKWEGADMEVMGHIAAVRHQMGIAIAPQVVEYACDLLDGGEDKLVIFAWHIEVLNILERKLAKYGCLRVDGSTSAVMKQRLVKQFEHNASARIILGNTLSMGIGTDGLQNVCNHALLAEPDWVPGNNQQAFDRLDRGGQKGQVQCDLFVAQNSIAEKVLAAALRKGQSLHLALDARLGVDRSATIR